MVGAMVLFQGPAWVDMDRAGSSTANVGKAAAFSPREDK